jgi:Na+-driven multidrug efflux pump
MAACVGLLNLTLLSALRNLIPRLFSSDPEVIDLAGRLMLILAVWLSKSWGLLFQVRLIHNIRTRNSAMA